MVSLVKDTEVYARYRAIDGTEFRLELRNCRAQSNVLMAVGGFRERNHGGRINKREALENAAYWENKYTGDPLFSQMGFKRV